MTTSAYDGSAVWAFAEHEHRDLARGINRIHDVAEEIGNLPTPALSPRVLCVLQWLDGILGPHMAWEDGWLFPEIEARAGDHEATLTARNEHRQIRMVTARLRDDHERLDRHAGAGDDRANARSDLMRLEGLIRAHLQREERCLLPMVEDGPPSRATETTRRHAPDRPAARPA